jgi:hypothetical protein
MLNNIAAITGGALPEVGDYESIATVTVGSGGQTTISFTSIPGTYKHLQIRNISREKPSGDSLFNGLFATFNSDTGSNYAQHFVRGSGSAAQAGAAASQTSMGLGGIVQGGNAANIFGVGVIDILDYANTSKYKTVRTLFGYDANGSGYAALSSNLWQSKNAITSITMTPVYGIAEYSSFALYGIK